MGSEGIDSDLGEPPQLQADIASFLQGSSKTTEEESKEISLEPPVSSLLSGCNGRPRNVMSLNGGQNYLLFYWKT